MTFHKFPDSRVSVDGITGGQVAVAAAALEKIALRLDEQEQAGAACDTGKVIILSAEDDAEDTIRPRCSE